MSLEILKSSLPNLHLAEMSASLEDLVTEKLLKKYATDYDLYHQDFSTYKFRPHAIHHLMGGIPKPLTQRQDETLKALKFKIEIGKKLTEAQFIQYGSILEKKNAKPILSPGAITYLHSIYKENVFNRTNEVRGKYLDKGLAVESEAIALYNEVYHKKCIKNKKRYTNDYFSGEPDIILKDEVIDIKSSWDFTTFPMMDKEIKQMAYFYQLQAYMDLLGYQKARLIYILVDTPEVLIQDELYRVSRKLGIHRESLEFDLPKELEFEIIRNLTYEDISKKDRIKIFTIKRDQKIIDQMHHMVELARNYLIEIKQEQIKIKNYEYSYH